MMDSLIKICLHFYLCFVAEIQGAECGRHIDHLLVKELFGIDLPGWEW